MRDDGGGLARDLAGGSGHGASLRAAGEARPTGRPSFCEEAKAHGCAPPCV
jgi:hypothetical protein